MGRKTIYSKAEQPNRLNRISPATNTVFHILLLIFAVLCIVPLVLVFMVSVSSEASLAANGYRFVPSSFSGAAYSFLWNERATILHALWISVLVTVLGTVLGLLLTSTMGYVLSRPGFRLKGFFTYIVFIPMIFNGGMLANYVVTNNLLGLGNNILALILPLAVSSFNIVICKTFFKSTIPESIIESAKIDGAAQFRIFGSIVLPISKPVLATIGLFLSFGYWNDWFQSSLYITDGRLFSLQALLNKMITQIQYIAGNPSAGASLQQYISQMPTEGVRMAIAVVVVIPIACAYPFFQKYFISGLTIGAVKG